MGITHFGGTDNLEEGERVNCICFLGRILVLGEFSRRKISCEFLNLMTTQNCAGRGIIARHFI